MSNYLHRNSHILGARRRLIHLPRIGRLLGMLLLLEAIFMAAPLAVSIVNGDDAMMGFIVAEGATLLVGCSAFFLLSGERGGEMSKRDGFLLTSLVWVVFSLFGLIPFMFDPLRLDFAEAFFESMSGFTTTGASTLSDIESLPMSIHLWRCIMQWIGGIGIIIFTIAFLPMFNSSGGMQMFNAELSGVTHDKIRPRISQTAKRLWGIYFVLTVIAAGLLYLGPMSLFESICHALATVSTGGFTTVNGSMGAWDSLYVRVIIMVFMFLGGVNFVLIYRASLGQVRRVWRDDTFRTYIFMIVGCSALISAVLIAMGDTGLRHLLVDPLFQVISAVSSTGYTVDGIDNWGPVVLPVLIFLLFCGACAGSTSGGIKIDRIVYVAKNAANELRKSLHPNRVYPITINGVVKPPELITKVGAFFTIYFLVLVIGSVALTATGLSVTESFFAAFSCLGNTGLGIGHLAESYAIVSDGGKMLLSLLMLIGRLEFFTVLVLLLPAFWRR